MKRLETGRLHLLPMDAGDEDFYVGLFTDPVTLQRIAPAQTEAQARAGFQRLAGAGPRALAAVGDGAQDRW